MDKTNNYKQLETKRMPEKKIFEKQPNKVRAIDLEAPVVYGSSKSGLRRLKIDKMNIDKSHHNEGKILQ